MKHRYNISADGTWLSIARVEWLRGLLLGNFPNTNFDAVEDLPGNTIDFKIVEASVAGMASINEKPYAFVKRGDPRNIAIFNKNIEQKLQAGNAITLAASAGQQAGLTKLFLQKALPAPGKAPINLTVLSVPDNLESLLLGDQWDGVIVPLGAVNDLLQNQALNEQVASLLSGKKIMVLPLFEAPPQAGQSALAVTADPVNADALLILEKINNDTIATAVETEYRFLAQLPYAAGAGVFSLDTGTTAFSFAAGINDSPQPFGAWEFDTPSGLETQTLFASTDYMKDFFSYAYFKEASTDVSVAAMFISSHKAIHSPELANAIATKRVWAAGTRTWYELAKKGIWVEGCADGLGLEFLESSWLSPLIGLNKTNVQIITNAASAQHWIEDGWNTAGTYELIPSPTPEIAEAISKAQFIFWTSFQQYEQYKIYAATNALHGCPAGKTAKLLLAAGLKPVIFPTIKAFNDWRATNAIA